ncbi:MAG TPA: alpha/beta fold hydrolase [Mycobacteriales bacterium]|nr:alpha/beta fold hydrolase [Mycobacteriales bacterium]
MDFDFLVGPDELQLSHQGAAARALSFDGNRDFTDWRERAADKLAELLTLELPVGPADVQQLRETVDDDVVIRALRMQVDADLSIPAYLLHPAGEPLSNRAVLALHGHGEVEASLKVEGVREDYHHHFAHRLAAAGHTVLLPELRGFGALHDLALHRTGASLTYWRWGEPMPFTLLSDGFQRGHNLVGDTVADLLRWERWLADQHGIDQIDAVGISYGGDLALTYPIYSRRVSSIFASGSLGSFEAVFASCGNAPGHCIPGVLKWFDRADIAGLNAPRPITLHYGERDTPGPDNGSAAYNDTAPASVDRLRTIYSAAGAAGAVTLTVSKGLGHEMDLAVLTDWLL